MKIETIADIVAEKRNRADEIERDVAEKMKRGEMISDQFAREVVAYLRKEADRIEAAAKREREVGAEAAQICGEIGEMIGRESALSDPPRNCDVGTAEEQLDRYGLFCQNKCPICENRHSCHICGERYRMKCMVAWAQLPYDEGDTK